MEKGEIEKKRKKGRPRNVEILGRERSHSVGALTEMWKRKRGGDAEEAVQ